MAASSGLLEFEVTSDEREVRSGEREVTSGGSEHQLVASDLLLGTVEVCN